MKQQQVAVKLQKLDSAGEGQYAWWAIVSIVLQAKAAKAGHDPLMEIHTPYCKQLIEAESFICLA